MIEATAYFTGPIRGPKGDKVSRDEINANIEKCKGIAAELRKIFGALLKIYCPHDQDDLIQVLWDRKQVTSTQIIDADLVILRPKDILFVYWPFEEEICGGCKIELEEAVKFSKPIIMFKNLTKDKVLETFDIIIRIIGKKYV